MLGVAGREMRAAYIVFLVGEYVVNINLVIDLRLFATLCLLIKPALKRTLALT